MDTIKKTNSEKIWFQCPKDNLYFLYDKKKIGEVTVDGVIYCDFHAEILKDKKNDEIERKYNEWTKWFRTAISGEKNFT